MEGWRERTWGVVEVLAAHGTPKTDVVNLTAFAHHAVFLIAVATRTRAVTPQCQVNAPQHLLPEASRPRRPFGVKCTVFGSLHLLQV
jgi:hypothetical protein